MVLGLTEAFASHVSTLKGARILDRLFALLTLSLCLSLSLSLFLVTIKYIVTFSNPT